MAPARPSLESAAEHLAFSSDPSGPWGHPPHSPELWLPWTARAPGSESAAARLLEASQWSLVTTSMLTKEWCHPFP